MSKEGRLVESAISHVSPTLTIKIADRAALVEFSRAHRQNPFSQARMRELEGILRVLDANDDVGCIVLTGGNGRSFGAGGDFHEVSTFTGGDEVDSWIDDITNLYTTIAGISKPVVAAIDGYAIGLGLQIALCCDYRVGSDACQLVMPELRMGIACNFGGFMLERIVGRSVMQAMLFTAEGWNAQRALEDRLLHEVIPASKMVSRALEKARTIGSWTSQAVQGTRPNINAAFLDGLRSLAVQAKQTHRDVFSHGEAQTRMNQIISKGLISDPNWILFTNKSLSPLRRVLKTTTPTGVHVYGSGAAISSHLFSWAEGALVSTSPWTTSIAIDGEIVRIRTGVMNDMPLYMVHNSTIDAWAVGTNSFLLNVVRSEWNMPVKIIDPTIINRDATTSFVGVQQLPAHSVFELVREGDWRLTTRELEDPVLAAFSPRIEDFKQAGSLFVSSLKKAVSDMADRSQPVATLLSGGVDSGAVTAFACLSGLAVTAYSAGTPWGNEHDEAQELADYLGIPHIRIDFSSDELLAAVPETMYALGTANRDKVDVALTVTAIMRSGIIQQSQILTGFGSDLLNMGLPLDTDVPEEMLKTIVDGIDDTRHSNEFTDFTARSRGKRLVHPYWHQAVVQTALDIHSSCKVHDGREKAFFRSAMEPYVPMSTAWRTKIGIHQGGGLQGGLDKLFGGRDQKISAYDACFRALTQHLLDDPFANIDSLALNPLQFLNNPTISPIAGTTTPLTSTETALTPSGLGVVLESNIPANMEELADVLRTNATRVGLTLAKGVCLDEEQFKVLVHCLGNPVQHRYKTGQADLMKLDATREKGKVVVGRGPLPLHTDGILLGKYPDLIILYASEFADKPGSGETMICDQLTAWKEMPPRLRDILATKSFEYLIEEKGHYEGARTGWYPIPTVRDLGRVCSLNLAMQFDPGVERSWSLRVADVSAAESDAILAELNNFLMQSRYTYQHRWNVGDLVVIDNQRTLHGRTAISEDGVRVLFRGQVVLRSTELQQHQEKPLHTTNSG